MFHDSAEVLRILLAIPEKQVRQEIIDGEQNFDRMLDETFASSMAARESQDAAVVARALHRQMVRAKVLQKREAIPAEVRLFYAALPAETIAGEATSVAQTKGRLGELTDRMEEIEEREGLDEGEYWAIGEGPEDYEVLSSQSEQIFMQVQETMFTTILRRYELGYIADLYDNDREKFNEMREIGRQLVVENQDEDQDANSDEDADESQEME